MDLSIPIIGIVSLLGYSFVKDGKSPRSEENVRQTLVANENPNGDNVYHSVYTKKVQNKQRALLNERFEKSKDSKHTGIVSELINGCGIECTPIVAPKQEITFSNMYSKKEFENVAKDSSIFKESNFLSNIRDQEDTLTGKPIDFSQANLQPFFRGQRKQVDLSMGGRMVEQLTGDLGTLTQNKRETEALFKPMQTKFLNINREDRDRYSVQTQKIAGTKPFEPILVTPIPGQSMRPHYKDVDELRTTERFIQKGELGKMKSRQGIVAPVGIIDNDPNRPIGEQYFSAAKSKPFAANIGDDTKENRAEIGDPFNPLNTNTPKKKSSFVTDFIATNLSKNQNNITSDRLGFGKDKRQLNQTSIEQTRDITERANSNHEFRLPNAKMNNKSVVRSNMEFEPTLKQGNLHSYISNPTSKRGIFNRSGMKATIKSSRESLNDTHDRYLTLGKNTPFLARNENHRQRNVPVEETRLFNQKGAKIPNRQTVGSNKIALRDTHDSFDRLAPILRQLKKNDPYIMQKSNVK